MYEQEEKSKDNIIVIWDRCRLIERWLTLKSNKPRLRPSPSDAESILHLQMRAYLSEAQIYNDYSIPPLIQTLMEIKREFVQQVFLKAIQEDGEIIGSVRGYLEKGTEMLVNPFSKSHRTIMHYGRESSSLPLFLSPYQHCYLHRTN